MDWAAYFRRPRRGRYPPRDIRIMVWIGLLLGLLAFQAQRWRDDPAAFLALPPGIDRDREAGSGDESHEGGWRVIDGDTFDQGGVRIRIADIDTPEIFSPACASEEALGQRARLRLEALLAAGPYSLAADPDGRDEDVHGRKLRIVTRGGRSLGRILVAEGLARPWTGGRTGWCGQHRPGAFGRADAALQQIVPI